MADEDEPWIAALDAALARAYPGIPITWVDPLQPDEHPLRSLAILALDEPDPHFLIVTYGLSAPDDDGPGSGLELTMRVARDEHDRENLPSWTRSLLEHLASYVAHSSAFEAGENFDLVEPLTKDSHLEAVVFAPDAVVPSPLEAPDGAVTLLQCVLLARDEYEALRAWQGACFTELLAAHQPLFVTHALRSSRMLDAGFRARCEEGSARDGSSFAVAYGRVTWSVEQRSFARARAAITIGHRECSEIALGLRLQLPREQPFVVVSGEPPLQSVVFASSAQSRWFVDERDAEGRSLAILVAPGFLAELCASLSAAEVGVLAWPQLQDLVVTVVADP